MKKEKLLSFDQVRDLLGIKSRKTILKYIKEGELAAYKLGGTRWRIAESDVRAFLRRQQLSGSPAEVSA